MTNEEYIAANRKEDIRSLALKRMPESVDVLWCLRQIEGWQLARRKLPHWAATEGLWFPPRLSMEQCSSEATALYKRDLAERLGARTLIDLTGGFGVDFAYMAQGMEHAVYTERQETLCETARHNFPLLGLSDAEIMCAEAEDALRTAGDDSVDLIYLDPARRDGAGRKTVAIEDCTPNAAEIQDRLLVAARHIMLKLSPMLDITQALRSLRNVAEVHVISVKGECKELLLLMSREPAAETLCRCVNIGTTDAEFVAPVAADRTTPPCAAPQPGQWLFEPNASVMKAGLQDAFALRYGLRKAHPQSNLFFGDGRIEDAPARQFVIKTVTPMSKKELKGVLSRLAQANITVRNFPATADELRRRWKLKDGGEAYLFATTVVGGAHVVMKCARE